MSDYSYTHIYMFIVAYVNVSQFQRYSALLYVICKCWLYEDRKVVTFVVLYVHFLKVMKR